MASERFSPAELLTDEAILSEVARRMNLETSLLERLADAVDSRPYDVFLFLLKYGAATHKELSSVFPRSTLRRALFKLEAAEVVMKIGFKYSVRKRSKV